MRKFISNNGKEYDSFLECITKEKLELCDINYSSIIEFLTFGALYSEETFFKNIQKKFIHQKYALKENCFCLSRMIHRLKFEERTLQNSIADFIKFFEERSEVLRLREISIDLTGGIDSRLIATLLSHFSIPFEAVYSLDSGNTIEAVSAQKVADALGIKLFLLKRDDEISEHYIENLFELSDGLWDILKLKSIQNTQQWRRDKGYNMVITGVGGELYKDFWWQQDFPFYSLKKPNYQRLYKMRMCPIKLNNNWLGELSREGNATYKKNFLSKLKRYKGSNTQVYDQIYYDLKIKEQISLMSSITQGYLDSYSPLLEPELLDIGYNLPRRTRFFNRFHRKIISKINSKVAKIPTTEGQRSVSSDVLSMSNDIYKYGVYKSKRLYSKFKPTVNPENETDDLLIRRALSSSAKYLKEIGVFDTTCSINNFPKNLHGRIITLSKVLNKGLNNGRS